LDKTVIEQLNDPFVHLVRNAIDHGIESPQQRQLAGKPAEGRLVLSARHSGASVLIGIRDDGAGIHGEALWQKAVNLGLVEPNRKMTDKEKVELMFHPGLSSRENVSATSGRGVGMDVVKRNIENLGGEIDIETSLGQGTTITLRLPLTLAIIEGLLIEVGGERFVIPLGSVVEVVEHRRSDSRHSLVNLRGEFVPYLDLCAQFELPEGTTNHRQIVVTKIEEEKLGLLVDQVIGEHQTVVKTLGPLFKHLEAISGATILGDGRVALIIDLAHLLKQKRRVSPKVTNL
jgi:two-component system chemotaxis sensor kinase CheA